MEVLDFIEEVILRKRKAFIFFDPHIMKRVRNYTPTFTPMVIM